MAWRGWEGDTRTPRPRSGPPPVEFFRVDPSVPRPPLPVEQVIRELVGAAAIAPHRVCAPRLKRSPVWYGADGFGLRGTAPAAGVEPPWWTNSLTRCAAVTGAAGGSIADAGSLRAYVERFLETPNAYEILYYDPETRLGLHARVPTAGEPFCPSVFALSERTNIVQLWTVPTRAPR